MWRRESTAVQWSWSSGLAGLSIQWQCRGGDAGVEPALGGKRDKRTVEQDHPALFPS